MGKQEQLPPLYSAVKVEGRKLYQYARAGREVERQPRQIEISAIEPLGFGPEGDYRFRLTVSKGTYVRTVCHDLGQRLGCGGAMSALRRLRAGAFRIEEASPLEAFLAEDGAALLLGEEETRRVRCGNDFPAPAMTGTYRLYDSAGAFLALAEASEGRMKTIKNFFEV